jgi:hypothetical protein
MQQARNDGRMTIGIFMAVVCDHSSAERTTISQHDVQLFFCFTADDENCGYIPTPEIAELFEMGYSAIAVLRYDPKIPKRFSQITLEGLPECLQSALSKQSDALVHDALSWLAREYN